MIPVSLIHALPIEIVVKIVACAAREIQDNSDNNHVSISILSRQSRTVLALLKLGGSWRYAACRVFYGSATVKLPATGTKPLSIASFPSLTSTLFRGHLQYIREVKVDIQINRLLRGKANSARVAKRFAQLEPLHAVSRVSVVFEYRKIPPFNRGTRAFGDETASEQQMVLIALNGAALFIKKLAPLAKTLHISGGDKQERPIWPITEVHSLIADHYNMFVNPMIVRVDMDLFLPYRTQYYLDNTPPLREINAFTMHYKPPFLELIRRNSASLERLRAHDAPYSVLMEITRGHGPSEPMLRYPQLVFLDVVTRNDPRGYGNGPPITDSFPRLAMLQWGDKAPIALVYVLEAHKSQLRHLSLPLDHDFTRVLINRQFFGTVGLANLSELIINFNCDDACRECYANRRAIISAVANSCRRLIKLEAAGLTVAFQTDILSVRLSDFLHYLQIPGVPISILQLAAIFSTYRNLEYVSFDLQPMFGIIHYEGIPQVYIDALLIRFANFQSSVHYLNISFKIFTSLKMIADHLVFICALYPSIKTIKYNANADYVETVGEMIVTAREFPSYDNCLWLADVEYLPSALHRASRR